MKLLRMLPLALLCLVTVAHAQEKYDLRYTPAADAKWQEKLSAEIVEALVQGQAMGISGTVASEVEVQVLKLKEEPKEADLQVTLKNIQANLNGQASQPQDPAPMKVNVDERGQMTLPEAQDAETINWADTGGIPLQFVVVVAHMLRLPAAPVAVGQEWSYEDSYALPGMGNVAINTRWKLTDVDGKIATLGCTAAAVLPDFKVPNPISPGTQVDVRGARVTITQMTQEFDTSTSRIKEGEAVLKVDARVDMGGFELPLVLTMKSRLEEVEE